MKKVSNLLPDPDGFLGRHWFTMAMVGLFAVAALRAGWRASEAARSGRPGLPIEAPVRPSIHAPAPVIKYTDESAGRPPGEASEMKIFENPGGSTAPAFSESEAMAFLKRFAKVAVGERQKFGIPASVVLATALVQSGAGQGRAAAEANNFFNLPDGSPAQSGVFFDQNGQKLARFKTPWDSFRANSLFIEARFGGLKKSAGGDWRVWAAGLAKGGYPCAPGFEQAVARAVADFHLEELDR